MENKDTVQMNLGGCFRLFVLCGASRAGKTTTLNKLAISLAKTAVTIQHQSRLPQADHCDGQYCYDLVFGARRIRVGISTAGDDETHIDSGFAYFKQHSCDVGYIAAKTSGVSLRQVEKSASLLHVLPQYHFLHRELISLSQNSIQANIVNHLVNHI